MGVDEVDRRLPDRHFSDEGEDRFVEMESDDVPEQAERAGELPGVLAAQAEGRPGQDGHAFLEVRGETEGAELDAAVLDLMDGGEAELGGQPPGGAPHGVHLLEEDDVRVQGPDPLDEPGVPPLPPLLRLVFAERAGSHVVEPRPGVDRQDAQAGRGRPGRERGCGQSQEQPDDCRAEGLLHGGASSNALSASRIADPRARHVKAVSRICQGFLIFPGGRRGVRRPGRQVGRSRAPLPWLCTSPRRRSG